MPYRPDFVEVLEGPGPRLHGRCPHCKRRVAMPIAKQASCPECGHVFRLLEILPVTRGT